MVKMGTELAEPELPEDPLELLPAELPAEPPLLELALELEFVWH